MAKTKAKTICKQCGIEFKARKGWMKFCCLSCEYSFRLAEQKGCCALCGKKDDRMLAIDYNPKTNRIRGLLCGSCNTKVAWYEKEKQNILSYLGV